MASPRRGTAAEAGCLLVQVALEGRGCSPLSHLEDEITRLLGFGRLALSSELHEVRFHARHALRSRVGVLVSSISGGEDTHPDTRAWPLDAFALRRVNASMGGRDAAGVGREDNGANNRGDVSLGNLGYEDFLPKIGVDVLSQLPREFQEGDFISSRSPSPGDLEPCTKEHICIIVEVCLRMMLQQLAATNGNGVSARCGPSLVCKSRQRRLEQRAVTGALARGTGSACRVFQEATLSTLGERASRSPDLHLRMRVRVRESQPRVEASNASGMRERAPCAHTSASASAKMCSAVADDTVRDAACGSQR